MEGVVDDVMRAMLSGIGGLDRCVTEFLRVTDHTLPRRAFLRNCPELSQDSRTPSGTPVYLQLLGGQPDALASNARKAARLGAAGIDLNFGCPAKCVNRHDGGSVLLTSPERVEHIVRAVRDAVPAATPVTVKIRLGFHNTEHFEDIVARVVDAGATELAIHARTRSDGYAPPAHWHRLMALHPCPIPLYVNGEIWSVADHRRALQDSGCHHAMLGRGLLAQPDLACQIRAAEAGRQEAPLTWPEVRELLATQFELLARRYPRRYLGNRTKQWLSYLRRQYPGAQSLFETIKREQDPDRIGAALQNKIQQKAA